MSKSSAHRPDRKDQPRHKAQRLAQGSLEISEVAFMLYEALDTPVSLGAALRLQYDEWEQLVSMKVVPGDYLDCTYGAFAFRKDYQAVSFMAKVSGELGLGTVQRASQGWLAAEQQCSEANARFRAFDDGVIPKPHLHDLLWRAREICHQVLGPFRWADLLSGYGFGPGASQQVPRRQATRSKKYSAEAVTSPPSTIELSHVVGLNPHWFEAITGVSPAGPCCLLDVTACDYDLGTFVNKDALKKRSIGVGPNGGVYLQKARGQLIRRRLKRWGIDLDDQTPNQKLAYLGSLSNLIATIDLASASDTVNIGVVRYLLPDDWFIALNSVRSRCVKFDAVGFEGPTAKFSAMGNGFTFELETLIFFSLAKAVDEAANAAQGPLQVYGDDIVCHTACSGVLIELLSYCGFATNARKTYVTGPFRESCGMDVFLGLDVTPIRYKRGWDSKLENYFLLYNQVLRLHRSFGSTSRFGTLLVGLYRSVNHRYRFAVPPSFGDDTGFKTRPSRPKFPHPRGWDVIRFPYWGVVPKRNRDYSVGHLTAMLEKYASTEPAWRFKQVRLSDSLFRFLWVDDPGEPPVNNAPSLRSDDDMVRRRTAVGSILRWE